MLGPASQRLTACTALAEQLEAMLILVDEARWDDLPAAQQRYQALVERLRRVHEATRPPGDDAAARRQRDSLQQLLALEKRLREQLEARRARVGAALTTARHGNDLKRAYGTVNLRALQLSTDPQEPA